MVSQPSFDLEVRLATFAAQQAAHMQTYVRQAVEAQVASCISQIQQSVTQAVLASLHPMMEQFSARLGQSLHASIVASVFAQQPSSSTTGFGQLHAQPAPLPERTTGPVSLQSMPTVLPVRAPAVATPISTGELHNPPDAHESYEHIHTAPHAGVAADPAHNGPARRNG
jgi:hypothetical protein